MKIVEDVRKTVTNPKPLYFAAGVGDVAVEAIKDAPARLSAASAKASEVVTDVAGKVAGAADSVQSRIALGQFDPKTIRVRITEPDLRAVREKTQNLVLAQVGWALEAAGKAVETYDDLSGRGKVAVERVFAGRNGADVEVVTVEEVVEERRGAVREVVAVDEVVVVTEAKPEPEAKPEAQAEAQAEAKSEAKSEPTAQVPVAAPRKATDPSRKKTTGSKD